LSIRDEELNLKDFLKLCSISISYAPKFAKKGDWFALKGLFHSGNINFPFLINKFLSLLINNE
jgi:hypothetical protein